MFPRFFAVCLVALIIAPVTAPFSTCDLALMLRDEAGRPMDRAAGLVSGSSAFSPARASRRETSKHVIGAFLRSRTRKSDNQTDPAAPEIFAHDEAVPAVALARSSARSRLSTLLPVAGFGVARPASSPRSRLIHDALTTQSPHRTASVLRL